MKNSDIRISYITEYITSYEAKIKALNKNGLFDSAKLFELFAIETCKLWFNQNFINLNDDNSYCVNSQNTLMKFKKSNSQYYFNPRSLCKTKNGG